MMHNIRKYLYWMVIMIIVLLFFYLRWKQMSLFHGSTITERTAIKVDDPIEGKIQLTGEFQKRFGARIESLVKRNATAEDPSLIQLIRDLMIPPFERRPSTDSTTHINALVTEVNILLQNKSNGFYIECGALDGEKASNTIYYERYKEWNGLLIEMDPEYFQELLTKRRHAWAINACIGPYKNIVKLPFKGKGRETPQLLMNAASLSNSNSSRFITCFPLEAFLLAVQIQKVDFFCFDIEGLEMPILKSFPFDRFDVSVLSVECLKNVCNEQDSKEFMKSKGYETHKLIDIQGQNVFMRDFIFYKPHINN